MTDRAASEVLSFALVFSLVVTSAAIVSVSGVNNLQSTRDAEQMNNAERAFDVLADNMADIYQRGAPSRATEISLEGAQLITDENLTVNVTVVDGSDTVTTERRLRPVVYQGGRDRKLVYEGGAVFRTTRQDGLVIDRPPFLLSSDRAYLQIVATQSPHVEGAGGSTILLRSNGQGSNVTVMDAGDTYDDLYVNVTSPRAPRWAEYLEETPMSEHASGTDGNGDQFVTYHMAAPPRVVVVVSSMEVSIER